MGQQTSRPDQAGASEGQRLRQICPQSLARQRSPRIRLAMDPQELFKYIEYNIKYKIYNIIYIIYIYIFSI